jgi:hypothetical protein
MTELDTSAENVTRVIDSVTTNCSKPSEYGLLLQGPLVEIIELVEDLAFERDRLAEEVKLIRRAWLAVIQAENSCPPSGGGCLSKRCGCLAEMEAIIDDARK